MKKNILLAMGLLASCCIALAQGAPGTVRIGVLTDMSGPFSGWAGAGSVAAAEMAVEEFKRSHPSFAQDIQVQSGDFQLKPDVAVTTARKWVNDGVNAIVDVPHSTSALAVNAALRGSGAALLVTGAQHDDLTTKDCSPNTVHWTFDTASLVRPMVGTLTRDGYSSWFFVTVDFAGGRSMEDLSRKVLAESGGQAVGGVRTPLGAADFSSFLLHAQSSSAKVVALIQGGSDAVNAMKQADEFGLTKTQKVVVPFLQLTDVHGMGLKLAKGLVFTEAFYWDAGDPQRAFGRRFAQRFGGRMPTAVHAGTYSAVLHYLKAVEASRSTNGQTVVARMKQMPVTDAALGPGTVRADGRMVHDMFLVQAKSPAESRGEWDLYNVVKRIKPEEAFRPPSAECSLVR
jgi:branched-chain amino acid transport system substrate-binding protein